MHDVWFAELEPDGIIGIEVIIKKHNCQLILGQGRYELSFNGAVAKCVEGRQLPRCARIAG